MIGESVPLLVLVLLNILFVGCMNGLGIIVTKYASAANRVTLQQTKNVLVWIFFLAYQGGGHETFKWLQLVGFIVMVAGVVLYNEIIELPLLGFNQYTKSAIERRKLEEGSSDENKLNMKLITEETDNAKTTQFSSNNPIQFNKLQNNTDDKPEEKAV